MGLYSLVATAGTSPVTKDNTRASAPEPEVLLDGMATVEWVACCIVEWCTCWTDPRHEPVGKPAVADSCNWLETGCMGIANRTAGRGGWHQGISTRSIVR